MKNLFFVHLAVCASLLALWACGKTEPVTEPDSLAPTSISLSPASLEVPAAGGSFSFTITAPVRPTVSGQPDWLAVKDGVYNHYKIDFSVVAAVNTAVEEREASLTVKSGDLSATFVVKQAAAEPPAELHTDAALTNASATKEAQNVYAFLREQSGKKVLSGVQSGDTANNNERVNQLFQMTGKHPALAGYDYIFLQYSPTPAGWSWVVNYGDISAQKEQWENNGLVSFMWHWNVPSSKADWDKGKEGNFEGYNFYSDKTSFSIQNALTEGTWENDFILQDIEKVAAYLKLLQEENIPVVWRPLHEAAGNYNLYGRTNNAWFWWGRGGAEPCKQLWKLLRDKLEGEYGLRNLIWVWTLDAAQGAENEWASWYPGNDLVDIVGVDIYADDTEAKERQYNAAVNLSGGHKMVTISECGNIPDPRKCLAAGQAWSWFLTWDLDTYTLNTEEYWKEIMSSAYVFTREDMPSLK